VVTFTKSLWQTFRWLSPPALSFASTGQDLRFCLVYLCCTGERKGLLNIAIFDVRIREASETADFPRASRRKAQVPLQGMREKIR